MQSPKSQQPPKKAEAEKTARNRILEYSNINRTAKPPPAYSTLKPETSSDSPSTKSKGARLVSATVEMNHITRMGNRTKPSQTNIWDSLCTDRLRVPVNSTAQTNRTKKLAS